MTPSNLTATRRPFVAVMPVLIAGLVLASGFTDIHATGQSLSASAWTERQLDVVPRDSWPNTVSNTWISFSDDLAHIAYAARFRVGDRIRESVVWDGRRGPEFVWVHYPALSPDGRRLAFVGVPQQDVGISQPGTVLPAYLAIGAARLLIQVKGDTLSTSWTPVFSPDGAKLAFRAERPSGRFAIGVLDVATVEADPGAIERAVVWGPEFDGIDLPKWAPDSSTVVYAAAPSRSEWVVMVGTKPSATYKDATGVAFSPSGVLAYQATDESGQFVMINGERQASFNVVTAPTFRGDGTVVYRATEGGKHYVVVGSQRREVQKPAEGASVSADGTRVMWWYREDERRRMVINGTQGRKFTRRVNPPVFHADAGTFAYTAQSDDGFYVVTPRGVSGRYQGVLVNPRISPDGTKVGFVAYVDDRLWWKVLPLK
jgi:Tol biopolymer transport system component